MEWNDRVVVLDHPIVQHKLAILRDKHTPSNEFRDVVRELSLFETYEATRDLPLTNVFIQTPIAPFDAKQITGRKVAFVPILRAGLGMVDGALEVIPRARVGHLGMQRNEETHEPESSQLLSYASMHCFPAVTTRTGSRQSARCRFVF